MSDDRCAIAQWIDMYCEADAERVALQARAEAAEAEVARLQAELAQARADAEVLAVAARAADDCGWLDCMQANGLTKAEVNALDALYDRLADMPDAEVVAVIRRALGCAR